MIDDGMKGLAFVLLTLVLLPQRALAQTESVDDLQARIAILEIAVEEQRRAASRNAVVGGAVAVGLVTFGLYRRRLDATRLTERFDVTDPLTGLKNRRYITQTIEADCTVTARQHRVAASAGLAPPINGDLLFVLIDIDRFKTINERHGHAAGDRVLAQIADVLRATCRTSDTIARWGGEEFLAILRFTNRGTAPISAERIRMAVEQRLLDLGDGDTFSCTCSIGFAAFPVDPLRPDAFSWEQVVAVADEALQRAKQAGGNTWVGAGRSELAIVR